MNPTITKPIQSVTLYFREGNSDKVYLAAIEPKGNGYLVTFAYGRRGSTMNTGTKTPAPVALEAARAIYDKLVYSKLAKGYTPGRDGTPYVGSPRGEIDTGIHPQLLNAIEQPEVDALLLDEGFLMQEKFDGRRLLVRKVGEGIACVTGVNRRGLAVAVPQPIAEAAAEIPGTFLIDGEAVGDTLHAFDLLERDGVDLRRRECVGRINTLVVLLRGVAPARRALMPVSTAFFSGDKQTLLRTLRCRGAEGVVFKQVHRPYTSGRPASGGDWLKFKFVETASFIVAEPDPKRAGKRSVALELVSEDGARVPAGNVTIPPNHRVPEPGSVVEIRYLYAAVQSGAVYQPVYLGPREDIPAEECTVDQLKYKPEPAKG